MDGIDSLISHWLILVLISGVAVIVLAVVYRVQIAHFWNGVEHAFRTDPPPLYLWLRDWLRGIADEWGPQLARGTNRNALMLALTSQFGLFMPLEWAEAGARYVVLALLIYYLLRVFANRKIAEGPIITARDRAAAEAAASRWTEHVAAERAWREMYDDQDHFKSPPVATGQKAEDDIEAADRAQNAPAAASPARRVRKKNPSAKKKPPAKPAKKPAKKRA